MPMTPSEDLNGYSDNGQTYLSMLGQITKNISQYPGYKTIASSLGKYIPQKIVAGLIGCIIPESGSDHTTLNATEFKGNGTSGTEGWNCGEGLIQWTYWKYKLPLIKQYNSDSRSTQKLPTNWEQYKLGTPITKGSRMYAQQDGRHIAGLSLDNQMLFLTIYYSKLIKELQNENNLAVIVAKIYQQKAGIGYNKSEKDPIIRAYKTSRDKYKSTAGNHYLQSLKIAYDYMGEPIPPDSIKTMEGDVVNTSYEKQSSTSYESVTPTEISAMDVGRKKRDIQGVILGYHMRQK